MLCLCLDLDFMFDSCHFKSEKSIKCVLTYDSVCSS